jgi:hypothetical protein
LKHFLRFLKVVGSKSAGFDQMRHERLGSAAKQAEELIDQPPLSCAARNERLEHVNVPDLPGLTQRFLRGETIDRRLYGCIGGLLSSREGVDYIADAAFASAPQ